MNGKKNTGMYLAALLLFLGGAGWLVFLGLSQESVYFLNVAEAMAAPREKLAQVRLFGTVSEQNLEKHTHGADFLLVDKDDARLRIPVRFRGVVPDTFRAGSEVIVEGGMLEPGHFTAKTLMTKCPSKYQKQNRKS